MAVKIRLKRIGTKKKSYYRVVVMDARKPRDGRAIEEVGIFQPLVKDEDKQIRLKDERIHYWLSQGAIPTGTVQRLFTKSGLKIEPKNKKPRKVKAGNEVAQ